MTEKNIYNHSLNPTRYARGLSLRWLRINMIFDLDDVLPHFQNVNRAHYLGERLQNASSVELHKFKKEVSAHKKKSKFVQDIMPGMSQHDTIIAAINFELLKRSEWYPIYKLILPLRVKVVSWFSGVDIQEHPYCGVLYVKRQNRKSLLQMTVSDLTLMLKTFWFGNWRWLIKIIISLGVLIVAILTFIGKQSP